MITSATDCRFGLGTNRDRSSRGTERGGLCTGTDRGLFPGDLG